MASVSLATTPSTLTNLPSSPMQNSAHRRKHSRNPTAGAPLPAFSFNSGMAAKDVENQPPVEEEDSANPTLKRGSAPPPLPAFTFNPGAAIPADDRPSPTHPVLEEMAMNQQRMSRSARPTPLPAFTFAPATNQLTPSPSHADFPDSGPGRPITGHKRAGSEFVGGSSVEGPTLMSTSPHKPDSKAGSTSMPTVGRRGHAHRRSQAVSISDIDTSDLIKTHAIARHRTMPSGPSTPPESQSNQLSGPESPVRTSFAARSPPSSPRRGSFHGSRPRVEFADKIDVIPRPLSLISSETEGSCSTARYSHSLSNSINSIASPIKAPAAVEIPVKEDPMKQRPKTADPATLFMATNPSVERLGGGVTLPKRPLSACGSPVCSVSDNPPVKRKHFWSSYTPERTPTATPTDEKADPLSSTLNFSNVPHTDKTRPKTSPERSTRLKTKKYHTWTAGIFSKKTKFRASKAKGPRRTPTPPAIQRVSNDKVDHIFDADDTIVLRADSPDLPRTRPVVQPVVLPTPVSFSTDEQESPVLDLDAALDMPANDEKSTPDLHHRGASSRIAKLHSSERRGVVDAFGVHRRTESAPAMPAFNRTTFGMIRHGSNSSLVEDVFDEEEEDNFLAKEKKKQNVTSQKDDSDATPKALKTGPKPASMDGLGLSHVSDVNDDIIIYDPEEPDRSSKSTIEAPTVVDSEMPKRPMSSPMSLFYPSTQSYYASSTEGRTTTSASMVSSPDPEHIHFDSIPRLTPSLTPQSQDFYLRPSNEDLPSLSDSISTGAVPRISSSANTRSSIDRGHDQRSMSMFVPESSKSNNSWKRSSLASLNRLIPGSANGSRLKFETTFETASVDKVERKKQHRLSKLVNFWRSKDKH